MSIEGGRAILDKTPVLSDITPTPTKGGDIILSNFITKQSETECKNGKEGNCFPEELLDKMILEENSYIDLKQFITPIDKLDHIKKLTKCETQRCVAESDKAEELLWSSEVAELKDTLKTEGPKNTTEWLSNFNINNKLQEIMEDEPNLKYLDTTMNDFAKNGHRLGDTQSIIDDLNNNMLVACVINTDTYESCKFGSTCGQHWVCVVFDGRKSNISLEYYDSVGKPPSKEISKVMNEVKDGMKDRVCNIVVNPVQHQLRNTECGVYCLFYIMSRCEEVPYSSFHDHQNKMRDEQMISIRRTLFTTR